MAFQQRPSSSSGGKMAGSIAALLIGIICMIIASSIYPNNDNSNVSTDPNAMVTCDGQTMNQGDTCVHTISSTTYGTGSYDDDYQQQALYQQVQKQKTIAEIVGGIGALLGLMGLFTLIGLLRERRYQRRF